MKEEEIKEGKSENSFHPHQILSFLFFFSFFYFLVLHTLGHLFCKEEDSSGIMGVWGCMVSLAFKLKHGYHHHHLTLRDLNLFLS